MNAIAYQTVMKTIKNQLGAKTTLLDGTEDPLAGTSGVTLGSSELRRLFRHLVQQNSLETDRDHMMYTLMLGTIGRSDDLRLLRLSNFLPPRHMPALGRSSAVQTVAHCQHALIIDTGH